ncbi:MAG TPA: peptidylprolyl isomerase [Myxococcaceae bacterium]|nr:peptidylprolyl isomerase [Myxococcaceae bacterium]
MKLQRALLLTALLAPALAFALPPPEPAKGPWTDKVKAGTPLFATLKTNKGDIVLRLFSKEAPLAVGNFVGLATGEQPYTDPTTGKKGSGPYYRNVTFHRVIPGFMIQGGDPTGTGRGNPGYAFADEFDSGRSFDKPGLLAMANSGPGTNGGQFFITVAPTPHLNNRHTIFGEVLQGYPVVEAISRVERAARDKPVEDVVIRSITFSETAPKAPAAKGRKKAPAARGADAAKKPAPRTE